MTLIRDSLQLIFMRSFKHVVCLFLNGRNLCLCKKLKYVSNWQTEILSDKQLPRDLFSPPKDEFSEKLQCTITLEVALLEYWIIRTFPYSNFLSFAFALKISHECNRWLEHHSPYSPAWHVNSGGLNSYFFSSFLSVMCLSQDKIWATFEETIIW